MPGIAFHEPSHAAGIRPARKTVVLYVGRLAPEKNLECLVRAAAALPEDAVLVIAGSGSLGTELQDLAVRLEVSAIFTGWLEGERLAAWYNLADVFVLPSLVEPFGAVVNDAPGRRVLLPGFRALRLRLPGPPGLERGIV